MRNDPADLLEWRLQVHFFDRFESALFASRQEAMEYAQALRGDYGHSIGIKLMNPRGEIEILQESPYTARDGTA